MLVGHMEPVKTLSFWIALAFAGVVLASPAQAATKHCASVTGHPGGRATWKIDQIRLTSGFSCKAVRSNIRTWVGFGGIMSNPRALAPWRCRFGTRTRCTLRTSFGGTKPLRTYKLRFRVRNV
jgi:hypothetical protein